MAVDEKQRVDETQNLYSKSLIIKKLLTDLIKKSAIKYGSKNN